MGVSRRTFLATAVGGSAAAGLSVLGLAPAASAASPPGDVVGKVTVGYQGWFACIGDGAPINAWWHWAPNSGQAPSPSNNGIKCWPDVREYTRTYQTGFAALGNGGPATLFSSYDQQTVNTHFLWMQQNGIDTAALQRFNPNGAEGPTRDAMATKVRSAAEAYGRKFYIMYDVTGWTNMQSEIKTDWTNKMKAHTASSAYAVQNGKPVVCIWGFGFNDSNHPATAAAALDVINWFKAQGCYVIGGVPTWWRTGTSDSRAGFLDTYHAFNMISPWMVGRIGNVGDADNFYNVATVPDLADCAARGIDYQPCVLPGDVSARQRAHGDFMWRQFYNMVRAGVQGIYISMYDEYNEGNQIAKTAESQAWTPSNGGMLALDEDGTACSSDYYLRLTGDGGRMLKGQIALTATRPTQPMVSGTPPGVGSVISLKALANNLYVCADNTGTSPLIANRTSAGAWEQFTLVDAGNGNVALLAHANNQYVCADNTGTSPLIANRTGVGTWESFQLIRNAGGTVSLKALANSLYVSADNTGTSPLIANRTAIGTWEQFTMTTA
ncbi:xylosidase [Streptomyces sp. NPDC058470]|uniref:xylosidase n=1 Tax=Streptomyces sp. NPDC058470 TaxID=3346515 RepID=UPI003647D443